VSEPVAFYPLNARCRAAEKENRQPKGILRNVGITNGPYNEPGGAYMFYGTNSSYIEFPNTEGPDIQFTLMCWVQPGGQDGPLASYVNDKFTPVSIKIDRGNFLSRMLIQTGPDSGRFEFIRTTEVLPAGRWVHVAASYDNSSGNNSLYINGELTASKNIGTRINAASQRVIMGVHNYLNEYFKGKIAEMKVYDVALNEAQIQTSIRQGSCNFFPKSFSHYLLWCFLLLIIFPLLDNFARGR